MKRKTILMSSILSLMLFGSKVHAQPTTYTVVPGDSMWKIAVKYEIGISEIISANPQISNPSLIYPGQQITVPNIQDVKNAENKVVTLVNAERAKAGLPPLKANWQLSRIARYKSQDMIDKGYFSHTSPTYGSPFTMIQSFGINFSAAGENIAMGQQTPEQVMTAWMNSPGHRSNILSPAYSEIGVGLAKNSKGVPYWTQMFIKPY
ncbi:SafA/ExsA family spore coat assembly protein [Clostridium sp. PL3]|uniref:SafA/ExsA family spore coat assembly protein n=1 Tax=Clostridium thailandense TaxID=2794346 RepID=A0A949U2L9_9CLOT|nr:SafA/ExsA family spore coat assembly protein [Clostridium thailandense]MBV7275338.1 SafA/ExsA family spore coat assembly protein [Clostridium thailandense]